MISKKQRLLTMTLGLSALLSLSSCETTSTATIKEDYRTREICAAGDERCIENERKELCLKPHKDTPNFRKKYAKWCTK